MNDKAKIKNKFVSPYPTDPVKIGWPKKIIRNLPSLFFSFRWKFRILDSFRQQIDIFALPSTSLS
jgi:hypothetical protein